MTMDISVVIPTRDRAHYLAAAVASVKAQTRPASAVIIVDDGSCDDTATIVQGLDPSVIYVYQENAGAGAARNAGAKLVETEFLAFLDSDDIWVPEKLAWQTSALAAAPDPAMVFGHAAHFVSAELSPEEAARLKFDPAPMPAISPSAILIRTADFHRVGPFDVALATGEFIEWYARARALNIASCVLPQIVMHRRLHGGNMGRTGNRAHYARALKAVIDQRRKVQE
ncbi:MAG: glycosyltransferase family 2 protein [Nevskia sp.]|nr:glycosyltransferase family 2 protein [Nevskia sp.]